MRLYHYTRLENFWKIWITNKLLFANSHVPSNNDFFERRKSFYVSGEECYNFITEVLCSSDKKKIPNAFSQLNRYKQISFTKDFCKKEYGFDVLGCLSPMMWGHYADNGRGVCLEFESDDFEIDVEKVWADKIHYVDKLRSFKLSAADQISIELIDNAIKRQRDVVFFEKGKHWQAENEFRLVSKDIPYLDIRKSIRKIIVPSYDGKTANLVKKLVNKLDLIYFLTTKEEKGYKELIIAPYTNNSK